MNEVRALFAQILPRLAVYVRDSLEAEGYHELAGQVDSLRVFARVDSKHGVDIYTQPRPTEPWNDTHRTLSLRPGVLHVDVVDRRIALIEFLSGYSTALRSLVMDQASAQAPR